MPTNPAGALRPVRWGLQTGPRSGAWHGCAPETNRSSRPAMLLLPRQPMANSRQVPQFFQCRPFAVPLRPQKVARIRQQASGWIRQEQTPEAERNRVQCSLCRALRKEQQCGGPWNQPAWCAMLPDPHAWSRPGSRWLQVAGLDPVPSAVVRVAAMVLPDGQPDCPCQPGLARANRWARDWRRAV